MSYYSTTEDYDLNQQNSMYGECEITYGEDDDISTLIAVAAAADSGFGQNERELVMCCYDQNQR